jgi:hypothetical protein
MSVVVGHTCDGHGLSGVGQTFLGCALLISCLSVYEMAELASAWSESDAQVKYCLFVSNMFSASK